MARSSGASYGMTELLLDAGARQAELTCKKGSGARLIPQEGKQIFPKGHAETLDHFLIQINGGRSIAGYLGREVTDDYSMVCFMVRFSALSQTVRLSR
jgi:hypothetical protein